jgi:hypothetical protein
MRTLSVVCVLLIAAFTTADITLPNIRPGQVISALQKDTYASSLGILSTDKETRARNRALQRRRPITRRPKWIPKLQHIPEEEEYVHMAEASPSRKAKRNVPSTTTFGTTGASIP